MPNYISSAYWRRKENEHYINISKKHFELPIYRFTTFERILQLFEQCTNTIVSPGKWDDPFENLLSRLEIHQKDGEIIKNIDRSLLFGQCWTSTEETDATWRIYIPNGGGVRIKSTVHKLHSSLWNIMGARANQSCYIGKVSYKPESEILAMFSDPKWVLHNLLSSGPMGMINSMLIKRKEFEHEQEIRLIFIDYLKQAHNGFFEYKVDPSDLILEIAFDPRIERSIYETYSSVLRKIGYNGKLMKSNLYRIPPVKVFF